MRYLSAIFLFFTSLTSFSQEVTTWDVDSLATHRAQEILNSNRTSEVLIFSMGCIGCEVLFELCECFDGYSKTYLIWIEENITKVERVDCCLEIESKQLSNNKIWRELQDNKNLIFNSEYKEDYLTSHYSFWKFELKPTLEGKHQIFDYYFDDAYEFREHNSSQASNFFRKKLLAELQEIEK